MLATGSELCLDALTPYPHNNSPSYGPWPQGSQPMRGVKYSYGPGKHAPPSALTSSLSMVAFWMRCTRSQKMA